MTSIEPTSGITRTGVTPVEPSTPARRRDPVAPTGRSPIEPIPANPPQDLLDDLDTAARVLDDLDEKNVDLKLAVDDKTGRVHVELRDADGQVLRRVPASQALDLLAGEPGGLADSYA
jgi:flagellar protein FlaG